jgi:hypothetical protein
LAKNLIKLLDNYASRRKIIAYVKDEGSNINIMIIALKSIVSCDVLGLEERFQGTCLGHAFCQYDTIEDTICKDLCVNQNCPRRFAKMRNMAKKIWKG